MAGTTPPVLLDVRRTGDRDKQSMAIPDNVPNVKLSHVGALRSFDAFLYKYALTDPAL